MLGRLAVGAGLLVLLCGPAPVVSGPAPRMRIVTEKGPVEGALRILFGGGTSLYAVPENGDTIGLDRAIRGVEWTVYRTAGPRDERVEEPGMEVGHRLAGRRWWGHPARAFLCPEELRSVWSAGRYVVRASHPDYQNATLRITVSAILLVDHECERSRDGYEASFDVVLTDPDRDDARLPLEVVVVDDLGRSLDRLPGGILVRDGDGHRTPRKVELSSRVTAEEAASREATDDRGPALRVVPDSRLRLGVSGRWFEFPLPLEEGPLVRRASSSSSGREGVVQSEDGRLRRGDPGGGRRRDRSSRGSRSVERGTPGVARPSTGSGAHRDAPRIEIVSTAGRGRRLKVWMGETVTFAARQRPAGLEDAFRPTEWLRDVFWTMTRESAPVDRPPDAIAPGISVTQVARTGPRGLWGEPPSVLTCPDDVRHWRPGRYRVRAERPDGSDDGVRLDVAAFEIVNVEAELDQDGYVASVRFRATDPAETRDRVPLTVRLVSARDEILDEARDVSLARGTSRRDELRSGRVVLSSKARRPCRDSHRDGDGGHPGRPCVLRVLPGSSLQIVLDDAAFTYALPLSTSVAITGGSNPAGLAGR